MQTPGHRRIRSIAVGSEALGNRVHIELEPSCTIMVGRNASGKSLIIESITQAMELSSSWPPEADPDPVTPRWFRCEIEIDDVGYAYESGFEVEGEVEVEGDGPVKWTESCRRMSDDALVWAIGSGDATSELEPQLRMMLPEGTGLLHMGLERLPDSIRPVAEALRSTLVGPRIVQAELPRSQEDKMELLLKREPRGPWDDEPELYAMGRRIIRLHDRQPEGYEHLRSVCARVLGVELELVIYQRPRTRRRDEIIEIRVGGDNLGLASDGTLRALQILSALTSGGADDLIILEEPELYVHPGLLLRLLNEVEAYSGQVLISTHSPTVLDWRSDAPSSLRFVSRHEGTTSVRNVREPELRRIVEYIEDEGALSDLVFSDEED